MIFKKLSGSNVYRFQIGELIGTGIKTLPLRKVILKYRHIQCLIQLKEINIKFDIGPIHFSIREQ